MAMTNAKPDEGDRMELLLPWYASGTLNAAEAREVEAWLAAHPEARERVALIREEMDESVAANESLGLPGTGARDRLMAAIAAEAAPQGGVSADGFWQRMRDAFGVLVPAGFSPAFTIAGAAAGVVILVQAAALALLLSGTEIGGVHLASGKDGGIAPGTFVMVRFADDAKAGDIAALLRPMGASIVDGPKPGAVFKVRVGSEALTQAERTAIMDKLRARRDIVSFVAAGG